MFKRNRKSLPSPNILVKIDYAELVKEIQFEHLVDLIVESMNKEMLHRGLDDTATMAAEAFFESRYDDFVNDVAAIVSFSDIAEEISLEALSRYIDYDSIESSAIDSFMEKVDYETLYEKFSLKDIASLIDVDDIAAEIDLQGLAYEVDINDLASYIDVDAIAEQIAFEFDLDANFDQYLQANAESIINLIFAPYIKELLADKALAGLWADENPDKSEIADSDQNAGKRNAKLVVDTAESIVDYFNKNQFQTRSADGYRAAKENVVTFLIDLIGNVFNSDLTFHTSNVQKDD